MPAKSVPVRPVGQVEKPARCNFRGNSFLSFTTSLVMEGTAFYNPSNTALGAVVWFTKTPALNRQEERLQFQRASA
jgi:hypothetical protein